MNIQPVRLTQFQREEMRYLLDVMEDCFDEEGDVIEDSVAAAYGFADIEDQECFREKLLVGISKPSMIVHLTEKEAACLWGEFSNRVDIAENNSDDPGDEEDRAAKKYADGMKRVEEAFPGVEFKA